MSSSLNYALYECNSLLLNLHNVHVIMLKPNPTVASPTHTYTHLHAHTPIFNIIFYLTPYWDYVIEFFNLEYLWYG